MGCKRKCITRRSRRFKRGLGGTHGRNTFCCQYHKRCYEGIDLYVKENKILGGENSSSQPLPGRLAELNAMSQTNGLNLGHRGDKRVLAHNNQRV